MHSSNYNAICKTRYLQNETSNHDTTNANISDQTHISCDINLGMNTVHLSPLPMNSNSFAQTRRNFKTPHNSSNVIQIVSNIFPDDLQNNGTACQNDSEPTGPQKGVNRLNLTNIKYSSRAGLRHQKLSILYFNAQSCRNKTSVISEFIQEQGSDLVFITETWFMPEGDEVRMSEITPPGYLLHSCPRKSRGGGIAIVFKESLKDSITFSNTVFESFELCKAQLNHKECGLTFLCIYRPPPSKGNKLKVSHFISECTQLLDMHTSLNTKMIMVGDFNLHYHSTTDNTVRSIKSLLNSNNMTQLIHDPTHKHNNTIDWLVVRDDHTTLIQNLSVTDTLISDHFPVTFNIDVQKPSPRKRTVTSRDTKRIDINQFKKDILSLTFNSENDLASSYRYELSHLLDKHAPLSTRQVTDRPSAPWLTTEIKAARRKQRQAERRWRKSKLTVHRQTFLSLREQTKQLVNDAKSKHVCRRIQDCSSSKQLYQVAKQLSGKSNKDSMPNIVPPQELPNFFSNFFCDKVTKIRSELDQSIDSPTFAKFNGQPIHGFVPVSVTDVMKILKASPKKSSSLDPVSAEILFQCLDELAPVITEIINSSLKMGIVPSTFKEAIVTPLLKKANLDVNILNNFRPISNLPFISKVLEKVVLQQLMHHFAHNDLLEPFQSAYRTHHSTETALLFIMNDLLLACDSGQTTLLSLLDLSAAFDTLDHDILLQRLHTTFGVCDTALDWFKSYLTDRTQSVVVNGVSSKPALLKQGVPQGSVLGPVLFSMYVTPLGELIKRFDISYHMYADDTQLYCSVPSCQYTENVEKIQQAVESINIWMTTNKLKLNCDKTELINIATRHKLKSLPQGSTVILSGTNIAFCDTVRDLGVYLDGSLSMEAHINALCKSIFLELRRISHIRSLLNETATKTLMSAFILSRMDYCNSLLYGIPTNLMERVQRAQNNAARVVLRKRKYDHAKPLLRELHWLPFRARIDYKIAMLCFKCLHGLAPDYLSNLLTPYNPCRSLRSAHTDQLTVPRVKLNTFGKRSFLFAAPTVWNSLPQCLRERTTLSAFKSGLKTHLFRKYLLGYE